MDDGFQIDLLGVWDENKEESLLWKLRKKLRAESMGRGGGTAVDMPLLLRKSAAFLVLMVISYCD